MANHFNDLLLQTLKEIGVRLDRLEGRMDQKADKTDVTAVQAGVAANSEKLDKLREDLNAQGQHLQAKIDSQGERLQAEIHSESQRLQAEINSQGQRLDGKLDALREDLNAQGQRLDRIEGGIGTLKWIVGAEVAVIGIILAFLRAC